MLLNKFSFLCGVALLPLLAWGEPSPPPMRAIEIQLNGEVKVGGEQVVLGDVATIYAKDLQNFKALSNLVLSRIPDDSKEVRLPANYLEARIRSALPPGTDFELRAPAEIVFRLDKLGISQQEFIAEIARMARAGGKVPEGTELEVETLSGLEQLKTLTLASARIEPAAEMSEWRGEMQFKITRTGIAANPPPVWVRAKLRLFREAWVATRSVAYSEVPAPALFAPGRVEITNLREDPIGGTAEDLAATLKSVRFRRALTANSALVPSQIERKPDASSGSNLRIVFVGESGVRVTADGALVGPGLIGGDVKARLRSSKKIVTGRLVSLGLVEVGL
jgi:flagella basal body P-ring formation protein FlgA